MWDLMLVDCHVATMDPAVAAPFGAILVRRLSPRILMIMVGIVLTLTSAYGIWRAFG